MPRQDWGEHRNKGRYLLTDERPDSLQCVLVFVPNDQYFFNLLIGVLNRLSQQIWYMRDDAHSAKDIAALWLAANQQTFGNGFTTCDGKNIPTSQPPDNTIFGGYDLDDLYDILMELDMKFKTPDGIIYEPVIPLEPCGCGDDDDLTGGTPPANVPNASGGGDYGDFTTLCDALTALVPYIQDSMDDFLDKLQSGSVITSTVLPGLRVLLQPVIDSSSEIEGELDDPDFVAILQNAIVRTFNDPWTPIERADLRKLTTRIPAVFGGAPMWAGFVLWAEQANINEINATVNNAKGTGDPATCAVVFNRVGRTQFEQTTNPPNTLEYQMVNDSGFTGLRLFATTAAYSLENDVEAMRITQFDECFMDGWTSYGAGIRLLENTNIDTIGLFTKPALDGASRIIQSSGGSFAGMEISTISGSLTTATQEEVASVIGALGSYTPTIPTGGGTSQLIPIGTDCRDLNIIIGVNGAGKRAETDLIWWLGAPPA